MATVSLHTPIGEAAVRALQVGDQVRLSGVVVTARDTAHKYFMDQFIRSASVADSEKELYTELKRLLCEGVLYHCGPVVHREPDGRWRFVSAGPTTSIREEPYEADTIACFGLRAVIGKGGMGAKTLAACREQGAVYLHAVGGAATLIANSVEEVTAVYKIEEFGLPEALWVIRVKDFPAVVTMDAHGQSLHERIAQESADRLAALTA